ncbi:sugar O-acyltransferase [Ligilactobacillus salitolerans]|uniref:Acetyltransferase n=1 Tax=Ligilactobacillus salitolerans TaxID=1808352 RepID=A0A401ISD1_9LACO|nr:sugar O-acetyltransferase [Ligilactobacillus salitolerans]GBG94426.1 sugar O-acyltransferase [Ligilactobacillus salitolerans]
MDNYKRKKQSLPYHYDDPSLMGRQQDYLELLYDFNQTRPHEQQKKNDLQQQMSAQIGENCHIETPLHANWGCHNVHFGKGIYVNFNLCLVDDADIYVGDHCMLGPNVVIATSGHPLLPILREHNYVYNFPVHIGRNVWIGSSVQILPGVTIGDNSVIGAGSVVTHDIKANMVAYGSPCEEVRQIGEKDRKYYYKDHELDVSE